MRLKSRRSVCVKAEPLLNVGLFRSAVPVRAQSRGPTVLSGRCPNLGDLVGAMTDDDDEQRRVFTTRRVYCGLFER